ncbi:MAG: hypothetical protein GX556_18830 [Fibrobacter sp.]|nr:hypothetical protein [Fibrobacter sp.]
MRYTILLLITFAAISTAQVTKNVPGDSLSPVQDDSLESVLVDTSAGSIETDSTIIDSLPVATVVPDSSAAVEPDSLAGARKEIKKKMKHTGMKLTKRNFDHKQQVFLAAGMMAFVAIIMTTAQTWNPE